ncbi:hypothetical protein IVB40_08760 [Bradyrhizobium sp. 40]|uniref:hypothetical protein n=1 Tax=Bradyrhizobium sp. 40 TaxID=2782674 RepID=UPI001FFF338C|nr:hypothetical protein [Bradyrhizobium sp. 40]UPJ44120.1 hypothetical protein IVB40_08760 [Bradyrhizobium sp. 40]
MNEKTSFKPDSWLFFSVRAGFALFGAVAALSAAGQAQEAWLWILAALLASAISFVLSTIAVTTEVHSLTFSLLGMRRRIQIDKIDRARFDELDFLGMFQIATLEGHFMLVPRAAFSDSAIFDTIERLASRGTLPQ